MDKFNVTIQTGICQYSTVKDIEATDIYAAITVATRTMKQAGEPFLGVGTVWIYDQDAGKYVPTA